MLLPLHPQLSLQQLAGLLAWSGFSLSSLLLNRMLLHFSMFGDMPCFLALGQAGMAMLGARLLLLLVSSPQPHQAAAAAAQLASSWRHALLTGACWGASAGLGNAALQRLPIPAAVLTQALATSLSHIILAAGAAAGASRHRPQPHNNNNQQQQSSSTALLCCYAALLALAGSAVWGDRHSPTRSSLSSSRAGVLLQAAASLLEACCGRMQLAAIAAGCSLQQQDGTAASAGTADCDSGACKQKHTQQLQQPQPPLQHQQEVSSCVASSSTSNNSTVRLLVLQRLLLRRQPGPLALLADSAPAAVLVLALPTALLEGRRMAQDKFRYRATIPAAAASCVLACGCSWVRLQPGVARALAVEPLGVVGWRVVRDVCVVLAASAAFNETASREQWLGYALAQLVTTLVLLLLGESSSSRSGGIKAAAAFCKLE